MMETKTLNEVYSQWETEGGVFAHLPQPTPWDVPSNGLDILYHDFRSGQKRVVTSVQRIMTKYENGATQIGLILSSLYYDAWTRKWDALHIQYEKMQNVNTIEKETGYHEQETRNRTVSENLSRISSDTDTVTTDMSATSSSDGSGSTGSTGTDTTKRTGTVGQESTSSGTDTLTRTGTVSTEKTESGTDTVKHTGTDSQESDKTVTTNNNTFGFNSVSAVPSDSSVMTDTSTATDTKNLTDTSARSGSSSDTTTNNTTDKTVSSASTSSTQTNNTTDTVTSQASGTSTTHTSTTSSQDGTVTSEKSGTLTDTKSATDADTLDRTREYEHTRKGNEGRMPTEYIQEELRIAREIYFTGVMADIDNVLCLRVW